MNNEPAFPIVDTNDKSSISPGLSKREWFSGMIIQGMIAHYGMKFFETHAPDAFRLADEMIKESEKSN